MHDASRATSGALSNRISTEAGREDEFPAAAQIRAAADDAGRARILLRLSDVVVTEQLSALGAVCEEVGFGMGLGYLQLRFKALAATRCTDGTLPAEQVYSLARWRSDLFDLTVTAP
jgi:hypothetical protein